MLSSLQTPGAAGMRAVVFLVALLAARRGPGPETLPDATVLVDSGAHELVIQLPPVDVPAAGSGGETMVGLPLCQVLVPVDASLHSSRVEVRSEERRVGKEGRAWGPRGAHARD